MALDWSKRKRVEAASQARLADIALGHALASEPEERGPSNAELRAQAAAALAAYRGPVTRLPTFAALRCRSCGHRGTARVPPGSSPSFKCSACGSSLVAWRL